MTVQRGHTTTHLLTQMQKNVKISNTDSIRLTFRVLNVVVKTSRYGRT